MTFVKTDISVCIYMQLLTGYLDYSLCIIHYIILIATGLTATLELSADNLSVVVNLVAIRFFLSFDNPAYRRYPLKESLPPRNFRGVGSAIRHYIIL